MRKRKLRPSFLLQCVTLVICVGCVAGGFFFTGMGAVTGSTLILMLCLWFLGIEAGLLPALLERVLVGRAESKNNGAINSIWFVDQDEESRVECGKHEDNTSNNPTIR